MSWDLEVYVVRQPAPGSAAECARDCGLEVVGEGEDIEVTLPGGRDVFFVSEPLTFETDDAPDAVLDANVSAGWLVQLNVPASSDDTGVAAAIEVASCLAQRWGGVVYDPQSDTVPGVRRRRRRRAAKPDAPALMSFRWYFRSTPGDEQGRKLLNVLRELAPDAAPVRYGDVEPLQHRLEREGESHFYEFWAEHSLPGSLSTYLFWEGRRGSEGFLNFPLLAARRRRDYQLASQLAIETETDRSQELLAAVAGALDAFYALVDPEQPEGLQLVRDQWIGIPPTPARHIWFGEPYASLLAAGTPLADLVWRWLGQGEIQTLIEQIENAPDEDTAQVLLDRLTPEIEPARLIPPL